MTAAVEQIDATPGMGALVTQDLRRLAAVTAAGLVLGFLVNGVGSRLAMMLLARLNPEVTGRVSDDGFRMGQFTLGNTMSLVAFTTLLGVFGGLLFLALRDLRFGPRWFQFVSMSVGPAIVVGAILVSPDGIDFRVLHPVPLAIGLFVLLPGLYALTLQLLGDHWLEDDSWFLRGSIAERWWVLLFLIPLLALGPIALGAAAVIVIRAALRRSPKVWAAAAGDIPKTFARLFLVAIFLIASLELGRDVAALT